MIRSIFLALLIVLFSRDAISQPYPTDYFGNPIDTPFALGGTFGEIRNDHFHSGLDITTGKEEGKHVYAAADGYVSRIKISAVGYGKALYITHPNGYVTVYAHLKSFSDQIGKFALKVQRKKESFEIDEKLEKNKLKIKKGSVIGLSGNTGSSTGPHLHFEIRDELSEEPINPLLFGYPVADTVKPAITAVRFYPVAGQGIVMGFDRPRTFETSHGAQAYSLTETDYIQVFGKIGFEFSVHDYQNNSTNPLGIYSMELTIDTQQVFSIKYDRINFKDTRYVNAHIDYAAKYDGEGIFERCFRLPGDKLKLYGDTTSTGFFEFFEDGAHDVAVTIKDFNGNVSRLSFPLLSYSSLANSDYTTQPAEYFAMVPDKGLAIHKSDIEIIIPANAIYETLLFTNSQSPARPGFYTPTFEIGDPHVPLHLPVTVSLRPRKLPEELKSKAVVISFNKNGKPVFEGNTWNNEFLTAKTKHFGSFSIAVDTLAPLISIKSLPTENHPDGKALRIQISDDLSGIKSYRAMLDDKWLLMEYDAKNNMLTGLMDGTGKKQLLTITVTDEAGNERKFEQEIQY